MLSVRKMEPKDFEAIKGWGSNWGDVYHTDQFPETGFIVDDIVAYFLYKTDSSVCWLENMISKPNCDPILRDHALDLLIDAALAAAKELGFSVAYATTSSYSLARRAQKHGALVRPFQILVTKELV